MTKASIALLASALLGFGSVAVADEPLQGPIFLSDTQMDNIVAGHLGAGINGDIDAPGQSNWPGGAEMPETSAISDNGSRGYPADQGHDSVNDNNPDADHPSTGFVWPSRNPNTHPLLD